MAKLMALRLLRSLLRTKGAAAAKKLEVATDMPNLRHRFTQESSLSSRLRDRGYRRSEMYDVMRPNTASASGESPIGILETSYAPKTGAGWVDYASHYGYGPMRGDETRRLVKQWQQMHPGAKRVGFVRVAGARTRRRFGTSRLRP
jgi:hypothetical protein